MTGGIVFGMPPKFLPDSDLEREILIDHMADANISRVFTVRIILCYRLD